MKKNYFKKVLALVAITSLLVTGTTACSSDTASQSGNTTAVTEISQEAKNLAKELLSRPVKPSDVVTKEVISATIEELKAAYQFESLDEIKIASGDWAYYADNQGLFKQLFDANGTKVTLVEGSVGNETQLFERNELHLTNRMLYPYLLFKSQGAKIIAVALSEDPNPDIVGIIVKADSDIHSLEDLKGKKVASWKAGCQYVALLEQMQTIGYQEDVDYTYFNVSNNDIKTALQSGEVDAVSTHLFTSLNGNLINGEFREIANAKADGVYVNYGGASVTFTSEDFEQNYPNILAATLKLREVINAYIITNEEEVYTIIEKITRVPVENSIFYAERNDETFYTNGDSLKNVVKDTAEYQNWLIENIEEFTEEGRIPNDQLFSTKFFK